MLVIQAEHLALLEGSDSELSAYLADLVHLKAGPLECPLDIDSSYTVALIDHDVWCITVCSQDIGSLPLLKEVHTVGRVSLHEDELLGLEIAWL